MPSVKMLEWESEFLGYTGKLKELVHKTVTDEKFGEDATELKMEFINNINDMFKSGHSKVRRMNKTVAFLHKEIDELKGRFTVGDQVSGKSEGSGS